jgi:hypothetical protein
MFFGIHTILTGERAACWNHRGEVRLISGPCRLWLWRETVRRMPRWSAREGEYLVVTHRDGRVEHLPGPAELWQHPVEHLAVAVAPAIAISAHEAVVVYGHAPTAAGEEHGEIQRRVVRGPAQFVPASGEWLHQFSWHGADPQRPSRKIPHALRFERLRTVPDQMYAEVPAVRTADDALLTLRFMVFFELVDIPLMLDQTHDPIADLVNALTADVIEFAAIRSFEGFKADTEHLNALPTFGQLGGRAERIGYRISKLVYLGYAANDQLQAMHDRAIEARTKLRLEAETETQAQEIADLKLQRERERAVQRQAMEQDAARHAAALQRLVEEERLTRRQMTAAGERDEREANHQQRQRHRIARDGQRVTFIGGMHAAGVDPTRWLVARYQHPDRLIRIDSGSNNPQERMHLHLDQP